MRPKVILTALLLIFVCASVAYILWDELHARSVLHDAKNRQAMAQGQSAQNAKPSSSQSVIDSGEEPSALSGGPSVPAPGSTKSSTTRHSQAASAANKQNLASRLFQARETQLRDSVSRKSLPVNSQTAKEVGVSPQLEKPATAPVQKVIVYYFHGTKRCPTCLKMEAYAAEAVRSGFGNALERGSLEWRVVNTDEPENEHFVRDYQLYTRSLVVAKVLDGKQIEWKNLERIWDLVDEKGDFIKYVQEEVSAYLGVRE